MQFIKDGLGYPHKQKQITIFQNRDRFMKQRFSQVRNPDDFPEERSSKPPVAEGITLCLAALILVLFGLIVLYSTSSGIKGSSSYYFIRQIQWCAVGLAGFAAVLCIGYKKLSDLGILWMFLVMLMLVATLFFPPIKGARRWIQIPGIGSIQPSEYAKVAIALFMAKFCAENHRMIEKYSLKFFIFSALCCLPVIGLVMLGRDMGTSILLSLIVFAILFASGVRLLVLLPLPLLGLPALFFFIRYCSPFRWVRLVTYLDPEKYQQGSGYQLWLSLLALGSGSWTGLGFAESRMKQKYLPEAHTDFILSIVGEEMGFICMCIVILLYICFLYLAIQISTRARTRQGMFLAFGLSTFLALQTIINIGVISGAFPTKGMPAPFISYGGSSLVTCLVATGLIVSIALDAAYPDYQELIYEKARSIFRKVTAPFRKKETSQQGSMEK